MVRNLALTSFQLVIWLSVYSLVGIGHFRYYELANWLQMKPLADSWHAGGRTLAVLERAKGLDAASRCNWIFYARSTFGMDLESYQDSFFAAISTRTFNECAFFQTLLQLDSKQLWGIVFLYRWTWFLASFPVLFQCTAAFQLLSSDLGQLKERFHFCFQS